MSYRIGIYRSLVMQSQKFGLLSLILSYRTTRSRWAVDWALEV